MNVLTERHETSKYDWFMREKSNFSSFSARLVNFLHLSISVENPRQKSRLQWFFTARVTWKRWENCKIVKYQKIFPFPSNSSWTLSKYKNTPKITEINSKIFLPLCSIALWNSLTSKRVLKMSKISKTFLSQTKFVKWVAVGARWLSSAARFDEFYASATQFGAGVQRRNNAPRAEK